MRTVSGIIAVALLAAGSAEAQWIDNARPDSRQRYQQQLQQQQVEELRRLNRTLEQERREQQDRAFRQDMYNSRDQLMRELRGGR